MEDTNMGEPQAPHSNRGMLIGAGVLVAVLALGAAYYTSNREAAQDNDAAVTEQAGEDQKAAALSQTSGSDATADIEADLAATDLGDVEGEMNAAGNGI